MDYTPRTDEQLKQLAIDYRAGKIWTDRHNKGEGVRAFEMMFMLIGPAEGKEIIEALSKKAPDSKGGEVVGLLYEYIDKAGPRSINGQPSFFSFQIMLAPEVAKFADIVDALDAAEKSVLT